MSTTPSVMSSQSDSDSSSSETEFVPPVIPQIIRDYHHSKSQSIASSRDLQVMLGGTNPLEAFRKLRSSFNDGTTHSRAHSHNIMRKPSNHSHRAHQHSVPSTKEMQALIKKETMLVPMSFNYQTRSDQTWYKNQATFPITTF